MYCEYKRDPGMVNLPWRVSVRLMALAKKIGMVVGIVLVVLLAVRVYLSQQGPELHQAADPARDRREAIACNALIDGLWIEGGSLPDNFDHGEVLRIALDGIGAMLGIRFPESAYQIPPESETQA